jgi:hypothetical protein
MDMAMKYSSNITVLTMINNCRLYLQIHSLAEICNSSGDEILPSTYDGTTDTTGNPAYHNYSKSKLTWPRQEQPPKTAWKTWKKFLNHYLNRTNKQLQKPLGKWTQHFESHRTFKFVFDLNTKIIKERSENKRYYSIIKSTRYITTFKNTNITTSLNRYQPITPLKSLTSSSFTTETNDTLPNLKLSDQTQQPHPT